MNSEQRPSSSRSPLAAHDWLAWICGSRDRSELRRRYDAWARDYEAQVVSSWRAVPEAAATLLAKHCPDPRGSVLDAGAGTGLVGEALARQGFADLTALDLSVGMLEQAQAKGVYRALLQGELEDPHVLSGTFAAVISIGVFAEGHAGPRALENLARFVAPGGLLVLSARGAFRDVLWPALARLPFAPIERVTLPVYAEDVLDLDVSRRLEVP